MKNKTTVFGGGCFWCSEAIFSALGGVNSVVSGYAGGESPPSGASPSYEDVCSGKTGHAEVVKIEFDPDKVDYKDLLSVFFATHDPTTPNRQGNDVGTQYRSTIFYSDDQQKKEAEEFIKKISKERVFDGLIVTEIKPLQNFYPAEIYHQKYFKENPQKPYCQFVINPKIEKLKKKFTNLLK